MDLADHVTSSKQGHCFLLQTAHHVGDWLIGLLLDGLVDDILYLLTEVCRLRIDIRSAGYLCTYMGKQRRALVKS